MRVRRLGVTVLLVGAVAGMGGWVIQRVPDEETVSSRLPIPPAVETRAGAAEKLADPALPSPAVLPAALQSSASAEEASPSPSTPAAAGGAEAGAVPAGTLDAARARAPAPEEPQPDWTTVTLAAGETLDGVLRNEAGLAAAEAVAVARKLAERIDPRRLQPGEEIAFTVGEGDGPRLQRLAVRRSVDERVLLEQGEDGRLTIRTERIPHEREQVSARLRIEDSLYRSALAAGVPDGVLLQAYRQLGHRVDFQRDLRRGDRIAMVFERFRHEDGEAPHSGRLLAVMLAQADRRLAIYRFDPEDGPPGYFDADGVSVETALARTPVREGRISSLFGPRDHPVLGYSRMHKGLDFAAPRGTAILAAGAGKVVRAAPSGSFGNYVRIRHGAELSTAYAHLSRFAEGIAPGQRVEQGEVIGYVGATGLATGPNLHYEVLQDGTQVDPRSLDLPPSRRLAGEALAAFRALRQGLSAELDTDAGTAPENVLVRLEPSGLGPAR